MKCEGELSESFKRLVKRNLERSRELNLHCKRQPKFKYKGKFYCTEHASLLVLADAKLNGDVVSCKAY